MLLVLVPPVLAILSVVLHIRLSNTNMAESVNHLPRVKREFSKYAWLQCLTGYWPNCSLSNRSTFREHAH
jgi:hypothetical protein